MKRNLIKFFGLSILFSLLISCENNLKMVLPQGPQGEKGDKGDPGKSAFDLWKEFYGKDENTTIEEFFDSLKGKDGEDGAVPVIGENGNWIIDGIDTGIPARGKDGKDGVTPVIGENGNWLIDGRDTGVPARGRDGFTPVIGENGNWFIDGQDTGKPSRGADGKNPTVEIGPGPDYYWIIDGVTTNITAKGQDGKDGRDGEDGFTPVIGENGNWWIDGQDTGKPSVIIPEIGPGPNYNWFIDGVDTGKPSRGEDGVDGKSAYKLWKEAVELCNGTVTNKDGSPYDCTKNSWEDFLIWLQGGDVSVLHQYWTTLPGNQGKTIQQFIDEMFDCHCDGITVSVLSEDSCVKLNPDGTVKETYNATLSIGGKAGTSVVVTGDGVDLSGNIANDQIPLKFTIPRGDESIQLTIVCTESGNAITKHAVIPALKYIKLERATTVTQIEGEEKDVVVINFATAPLEVSVGGTMIYGVNGVVEGSGWTVSNEGKTFARTYDRGANVQRPTVQAKGVNPICSIIENSFEIPSLTEVEVGTPTIAAIPNNNCEILLTVTGTSGMTVKARYGSPVTEVTLTEGPNGTYTTAGLPRAYTAYTVTVTAEMQGRGTVTKTVNANVVQAVQIPLTVTNVDEDPSLAIAKRKLKNNTSAPLQVRVTRGNNNTNNANTIRRTPPEFPYDVTIPANGEIIVDFQRDYTLGYGSGQYTLTFTSENECRLTRTTTNTVVNQTDYSVAFSRREDIEIPGGGEWGAPGQPGSPGWNYDNPDNPNANPQVTFDVMVTNAIPNSHIEFQLYNGTGYAAVFRGQADANGNYTHEVTMSAKDLSIALADGSAFFKFFKTRNGSILSDPYNIGAEKERKDFTFD